MIDLGEIFRKDNAIEGAYLREAETEITALAPEFMPDTCNGTVLSKLAVLLGIDSDSTREEVYAALKACGGLHRSFFEAQAVKLGWNIGEFVSEPRLWITDGEYPPFRVGISRMQNDFIDGDDTSDRLWNNTQGQSAFTWTVHADVPAGMEDEWELFRSYCVEYKPYGTDPVFVVNS